MGKRTTQHKIIDCHQHVDWQGYNSDRLAAHLGDLGVSKTWLLTWESVDGGLEPGYEHLSIEGVWGAYEKYPDIFIPFYAVDPRRGDAEERLQKWVKKGVKGYGELKVRIRIDNPDSVRMFRLCGDLNLPVLFHVDVAFPDRRGSWYNEDIDGLERVLKECSGTAFVAHGPGWWRYISADEGETQDTYPKSKVKEGGKLVRLLEEYPNLYADLSAGSGLNALTRDMDFGYGFVRKFYKKLLYGTDFQDRKHLDYLLEADFGDEMLGAILSGNAESLVSA